MQNKECRIICLLSIIISVVFSFDYNISLESKYGEGSKASENSANGTVSYDDFHYNEHIADINFIFNSNIYLYTQLEYSKPPFKGSDLTGLNNFNLEYSSDRFRLKAGDIYGLYGRGLTINMFQDHSIDYDNSLRGVDFYYYLTDYISIFSLIGEKEFLFRSAPIAEEINLGLTNRAYIGGFEKSTDNLGIFTYLYLYQESIIDYGKYDSFKDFPIVKDAYSSILLLTNKIDNNDIDTLNTSEHNFSWENSILNTDFYIEASVLDYVAVNGKSLKGSKLYLSLYKDLFGFGVTYEYKNYWMEHYLKTLSNPPIAYRESNSSLTSRNSHAINWNDEIGHQIDINKYFNNAFSIEFNISMAHKHQNEDQSIGLLDIIKLSNESFSINPFRQSYIGSSGWLLDEKLYYKIGFDDFNEVISDDKKYIKAYTIPSLFTYTIGQNSITTYLEVQKQINKKLDENNNYKVKSETSDSNRYLSLTFNYKGKLSFTYFYEDQNINDKWIGGDISYNINNTTQLSIFYGSQKGGLVCANGVCAIQPGLNDAIKLTFRSLF